MRIVLWLMVLGISPVYLLYGQNVVPNPGFESFSACPSSSCEWFLAGNWNSVNNFPGCNNGNSGSPDYFHTCGGAFYNFPLTLNGELTPLEGNAVMGLCTWLSFRSNFREYLSVPLTAPLQPGTPYRLRFSYTNGSFNPAVNYGGQGTQFGVHFSAGPLTQTGFAPIVLTPVYETPGPVFSTGWQTVDVVFTPSAAATHLTIGNFRNDAATTVQQFAAPSSPLFTYAYYYFDQITVEPDVLLSGTADELRAVRQGSDIQLSWEADASVCTLEHAADGAAFQDAAVVGGIPGSQQFAYVFRNPAPGTHTFRVRFGQPDGSYRFSRMVQISIGPGRSWHVAPEARPDGYALRVSSPAAAPEAVSLEVLDLQGRLAAAFSLTVAGASRVELPALPPGIYLIRLRDRSRSYSYRIPLR